MQACVHANLLLCFCRLIINGSRGGHRMFKGPGKRGHIVADTLLPTQMFPRLPPRATFVADTTQKMFLSSETFCVRNECFPVCAAQETWATMCPRLLGP